MRSDCTGVYGTIYLVTNLVTGKRYVGQTTKTVEHRWARHVDGKGRAFAMGAAIKKYGPANFAVQSLDTAENQAELDAKEILWIAQLNTLSPAGYNLTEGGRGGKHSAASKAKMSAARRGKPLSEAHRARAAAGVKARYDADAAKGIRRVCSDAEIARLRTLAVGCTRTDEHKRKISKANSGRKHTPEEREKMRQAWVGRVVPPEVVAKRVAAIRESWARKRAAGLIAS